MVSSQAAAVSTDQYAVQQWCLIALTAEKGTMSLVDRRRKDNSYAVNKCRVELFSWLSEQCKPSRIVSLLSVADGADEGVCEGLIVSIKPQLLVDTDMSYSSRVS